MLLCNNSVTSIDNTQLSLCMGYKRKVSYSHYLHIQSYKCIRVLCSSGSLCSSSHVCPTGVSNYYSPRMILNQTNLDYAKHCVVPFVAYAQANHESTKTSLNVTRTLDAIYLRLAQVQQGAHELMDLHSGQLI
jgi:hypothetical protein